MFVRGTRGGGWGNVGMIDTRNGDTGEEVYEAGAEQGIAKSRCICVCRRIDVGYVYGCI